MKAVIFENGDLRLSTEMERPQIQEDEALIRVIRAGVCSTDLEIMRGYMGFSGVPGHEFVGIVEECADEKFLNRRVVGEINIGCGECSCCINNLRNHCPHRTVLGILNCHGAFAEYLKLPLRNLHIIPENVSTDEAVFTEPLAAAFRIPEQLELSGGESVCLVGDGRLGYLVAQVIFERCKYLFVEGRHEEKLNLLRERGIPAGNAANNPKEKYDLVIDCSGSVEGLKRTQSLVRSGGTIVLKTTIAEAGGFDLNQLVIDEVAVIGSRCGPFATAITALAEKRIAVTPLIEKTYRLDDGVAALEFARSGSRRKVLITMESSLPDEPSVGVESLLLVHLADL